MRGKNHLGGFWRAGRFAGMLSALFLVLAATRLAADEGAALLNARNSIQAIELQESVNVLADDALEGRNAGSEGGRAAAEFLVQHLQAAELKPGGDNGTYFQEFAGGCRNVIGILPGSDPELKNQYVLLGAHYDHVGYGTRRNSYGPIGYVHNGADDNASGTSGVLETVDAFVSLETLPRRSLIFVLWDAEEQGLKGSRHFLNYPTIPLHQLACAVNVDMIGRMRNRRLMVFGTRTGWGLRRLVSTLNDDDGILLDFTWEIKANSDHFPFYSHGFPVLMFHTGIHEDLHRPSDDADKINTVGMQDAARLLFEVVHELANRDEITGFRVACRQESQATRKGLEQPLPPTPARFGVRWPSESGEERDGIVITNIDAGSPADRAGFHVGDRILEFDHHDVSDAEHFRLYVLASPSLTTALVQRKGESEPREVSVELNGKPTRLGVSWRTDDAEPGTLLLSRVVPGSPAFLAGLRVADRVYTVEGQSIESSESFFELVTTLPSPIRMIIERQGQLQEVSLDVPAPTMQRL